MTCTCLPGKQVEILRKEFFYLRSLFKKELCTNAQSLIWMPITLITGRGGNLRGHAPTQNIVCSDSVSAARASWKQEKLLSHAKLAEVHTTPGSTVLYTRKITRCTAFWLCDGTQIGSTVSPSSYTPGHLHNFQSKIKDRISCLWDTSTLVFLNVTHNLLIPITIQRHIPGGRQSL